MIKGKEKIVKRKGKEKENKWTQQRVRNNTLVLFFGVWGWFRLRKLLLLEAVQGVVLGNCFHKFHFRYMGELLLDNLYKWFGLPDRIISDRGPQFAARAFQETMKLLRITSALTTAYHPQSDGATERVNQEIEAYLSIYCSSHPEEWLKSLTILEFTYNNWRHADRTHTLFELINGDTPVSIPLMFAHTKFPLIEDKMKRLLADREEALAAHELARSWMTNRKQSMFTPFTKGQQVWLDSRNLKMTYHKKIAPKQEGPFVIEEVLGPLTYQLKLPDVTNS